MAATTKTAAVKSMTVRALAIGALTAGLVYTVVFGAFETRHFGMPHQLSLFGATDTLSVFHYPLIWLLSSVMFFAALYAIGTIRHHRVRQHPLRFGLSCLLAVLIALFYIVPQITSLTVPANPANPCTAPMRPTTNPARIRYSGSGFCPVRVIVSSGTTVEFVADAGSSLRIASDQPELNRTGNTFRVTMTKPGTFLYTDSPSTGASLQRFFSELLGRTQSHQGVIQVVAAK